MTPTPTPRQNACMCGRGESALNVAVICECSGVVRDAFIARGHNAVSCDILPSDSPGPHVQADARTRDWSGFDLVIAHPPCTRLAVSGARHFAKFKTEQEEALEFVQWIMDLPVPRLCLENPVSIISTRIRKPDQIIQPWQFGHGETKKTCLWLKGLPLLMPTNIVPGREARIHKMPPSADRGKLRSITYQGIADAMASQWGCTCIRAASDSTDNTRPQGLNSATGAKEE